jgi:prepilin-type N-terminal cleavage/methylation domain-containing protein
MLGRRGLNARRGLTILEVVIAMVVGGVVLALITNISVRQQRLFTDLTDGIALSGQLREAATILPIDLRAVSVASHDIREARDTSIELRGTIASGVVCDTITNGLIIAPIASGASGYASYLTSIDVGDTAWVFTPTDSIDDWRPYTVATVATSTPRQCAPRGPQLSDSVRALSRVSIGVASRPASLSSTIGSPIRVTRPVRYSLYRASDGLWYLGEKDWSTSTARFNTIQPVSGPFLSAASGGLTFTYLDSTATRLATPVVDPTTIAAIRIALRGQTKNVSRVLGASFSIGKRVDTATVTVLLHNRR